MGRLVNAVAIGLCFFGLVMGMLLNAQVDKDSKPPPEPQGRQWYLEAGQSLDVVEVKPPSAALIFNREGETLTNLTICGKNCEKPLAVIHPDGRVEVGGDTDEAARAFWKAVGQYMPHKCKGV